jgi:hypothetical protein
MRLLSPRPAVVALFLLGGCGSSGGGGGGGVSAATGTTIGPQGGTAKATSSVIPGASVTVPPSALASSLSVTVNPGTNVTPTTFTAVGPSVDFEPSGARLSVPATFTIPFTPSQIPAGKTASEIVVVRGADGGGPATGSAPIVPTAVDTGGNVVTFEASSFGVYQAAVEGGDSSPVSLTASTIVVDRPTGVVANGTDRATITVTVRDAQGQGIAGLPVTLSATGSNDTIVQPGVTDGNGVASGTIASTTPESKSVSASVETGSGTLALPETVSVTFVSGSQLGP